MINQIFSSIINSLKLILGEKKTTKPEDAAITVGRQQFEILLKKGLSIPIGLL